MEKMGKDVVRMIMIRVMKMTMNMVVMVMRMRMVGVMRIVRFEHEEAGLQKSFDILQSSADPGSCSPSAYVMIFQPSRLMP